MFLDKSPFYVLKKRWKVIFLTGLILAVLSAAVSLLFPLEYRADAQVLVISKSRYGVDPYTVIKSAERVGENLAQVMKTDDFFDKVMTQSGYTLDKNRFQNISERKKRKLWQKVLQTSVVYGTGVLNVSAFHKDQVQAEQLAGAAVSALAAKGWEYIGGDVTIKVVNDPIVTRWPVRPNLFLNIILGLVVGVLLMGLLVIRKS